MRFKPKTTLGKWAIALTTCLILFFIIFQILVASGQRGGDTFFDNVTLAIPITLAGISGISAFVTGITSIIRNKERSALVFLATTIGFLVLLFSFGEILIPH